MYNGQSMFRIKNKKLVTPGYNYRHQHNSQIINKTKANKRLQCSPNKSKESSKISKVITKRSYRTKSKKINHLMIVKRKEIHRRYKKIRYLQASLTSLLKLLMMMTMTGGMKISTIKIPQNINNPKDNKGEWGIAVKATKL